MAIELAQGYVSLTPSAKGIAAKIREEMGGPVEDEAKRSGDASGKGFASSFGGHLGGIKTQLAGVVGAGAIIGGLGSAVKAASDMGETVSKVGVVFGDQSAAVQDWAKTAATSFGMSKQEALEAAGTFGNLFSAMGIAKAPAADMSKSLVQLSGDLASFNNANPEEVLLALRSGIVGETEPLRRFGVNINEVRLKAEAFRLGLVKAEVDQVKLSAATETVDKATRKAADALKKYGADSTQYSDAVRDQEQATDKLADVTAGKIPAALDAATKASAAYSLMMHDTALAQGDFVRTGDGLANQGRTLSGMWKDLKAAIGAGFLPIAAAAAKILTGRLVPAFQSLATEVEPGVTRITGAFRAMFAAFKAGGDDVTSTGLAGVFERIGLVVRHVSDVVRGFFAAFRSGEADASGGGFVGKIAELGSTAGGIFRELVDGVRTLIGKIGEVDWGAAFGKVVEIVKPIAAGILDVATAVGKIIENGLPVVIDLWTRWFDVLQKVAPVVADVAGVLGTLISGVLKVLSPILSEIGDHMDLLIPLIGGAFLAFEAWKGLTAVTTAVKGIGDTISAVSSIADTFGVSFGKAAGEALKQTGPIESLTKKFDALKSGASSAFDALKTGASNIGSNVSSAFNAVKSAAISAATSLQAAAVAAYQWVAAQVVAAAQAVRTAAVWVAQKVAMIATTVATNAAAAAQWLLNAAMTANPIGLIIAGIVALAAAFVIAYQKSETFRAIIDAIGRAIMTVVRGAIDWLTNTALPAVASFVSGVADKIGAVITFFTELPGRILDAIGDAASWLLDKGRDAIGGLLDGIIEAHATMVDWVTGIASRVIEAIGNATLWLLDKGRDIMRGLVNGIVETFEGQVRGALNIGSKIIDAVGALGSLLYNAGRDVVSGLIDGIRSAFGNLWTAAGDLVSGFKDKVTGLFKIGSPSKVMQGIGLDVMAGLDVGIRDGSKGVASTLSGLDFTGPRVGAGIGYGVNAALPAVPMGASGATGSPITVNAQTNADPWNIAGEIAWTLRTAGR